MSISLKKSCIKPNSLDQPFSEFVNALRRKLLLAEDANLYVKQVYGNDLLDIENGCAFPSLN